MEIFILSVPDDGEKFPDMQKDCSKGLDKSRPIEGCVNSGQDLYYIIRNYCMCDVDGIGSAATALGSIVNKTLRW